MHIGQESLTFDGQLMASIIIARNIQVRKYEMLRYFRQQQKPSTASFL